MGCRRGQIWRMLAKLLIPVSNDTAYKSVKMNSKNVFGREKVSPNVPLKYGRCAMVVTAASVHKQWLTVTECHSRLQVLLEHVNYSHKWKLGSMGMAMDVTKTLVRCVNMFLGNKQCVTLVIRHEIHHEFATIFLSKKSPYQLIIHSFV